jgi:hypothetical protein
LTPISLACWSEQYLMGEGLLQCQFRFISNELLSWP